MNMPEKTSRAYRASKIFVTAAFFVCAVLLVLRLVLPFFPKGGEFFYQHVTKYLQAGFSFVSACLPFSLGETVVLLLPLAVILVVGTYLVFLFQREYTKAKTLLFVCLGLSGFYLANYILNLSVLYCRPALSELSGIADEPAALDGIYETGTLLAARLDELSEKMTYSGEAAICPYSFDELNDKIDEAYARYCEKNPWLSPYKTKAKPIALSEYLTYTHLSGIYTQFTGEANINTNYPHFVVADTVAHEKAHGRGIAPENEANLVAYFVLRESGDDYLEYCGILSIYPDILAALVAGDPAYYSGLLSETPPCLRSENRAYSAFFEKYRSSRAAAVNDALNDGYLKLNGEKDGIRSYGMTVNMTVAYELGRVKDAQTE